jgi:hypothetical protein
MSDARLYRQAGNALVAELDLIDGFSSTFQARTLRQRSLLAQPGTWDEQITPRAAESETGTLSILFHETIGGASPAARSLAAYDSLFLGVVHSIGNLDPSADVPALAGGRLVFTATSVALEQQPDRKRWLLRIDWERVHP